MSHPNLNPNLNPNRDQTNVGLITPFVSYTAVCLKLFSRISVVNSGEGETPFFSVAPHVMWDGGAEVFITFVGVTLWP